MFQYRPSPNMNDRARARVGTTVRGKFELVELLGTGGMACVYRAKHRAGREVALKIVHEDLHARIDTRPWILREAMLTNAIEHPGILRVLDDDTDDSGAPMLVMDLVRGESLSDHVAKLGLLPAGRALDVADGALDILAHVHDRGIVHCDIKPDNLLLTNEGVVLLDFGIARSKDFSGLPDLPPEIANEPMGTPDFMPPEQAAGLWDWVDARSDLYALGATLFLLLSGRFVRDGVSMKSQLETARQKRAPALASVAPHLRSMLTGLVDRALAFDPDARFASARAMQDAVRGVRERHVIGGRTKRFDSGEYTRPTLAGGVIERAS